MSVSVSASSAFVNEGGMILNEDGLKEPVLAGDGVENFSSEEGVLSCDEATVDRGKGRLLP